MDASAEHDPERLLAHAEWLRGLALRLAGDGQAAEDLAQETWLAALRAPLSEVRSLRAYLAGILRNQGRLRRRAEGRRDARERGAARAEAVPGADMALERAELARALVECVLALEEPFRSAVLLRYGEGLTAEQTAERLGVPVKTVESRARRGLARLRERWTRAHGRSDDTGRAWGAALLFLAGSPPPALAPAPAPASTLAPSAAAAVAAPAAAASLGALLMQTKLVYVALALAGGAGALWWWNADDGAALRPVPLAAAGRAGAAQLEPARAALEPASDAQPAGARAAVAPPAAPARAEESAATPPSPARLLRGRVLDVEARPLAGVAVGFVPGVVTRPDEPAETAVSGPDGAFELPAPRFPYGEVRATDPGLVTLIASRLGSAGDPELLLVVASHRRLSGQTVDEGGAPVPGARVRLEPPAGFFARFDAILDGTVTHLQSAVADAEGRFALDLAPRVPGAALVAVLDGFAPGSLAAPDGPAEELVLVLARPALDDQVLAGRVVDERGLPAAGAWVTLGAGCAVADDAGRFRLARAGAEDARDVVALLRGHRPGRVAAERDPATGAPRWPAWIEIELGGPPLALTGRVVDERGEPRTGVGLWVEDPTPFGVLGDEVGGQVEFLLAHGAGPETDAGDVYWYSTGVDETGAFELPGLLERDYRLRLFDGQRLETATAGPFRAGDRGVEVVFARGPLTEVAGRVLSRAGAPLSGVDLRLLGGTYGGISQEQGTTRTDGEGRFSLPGVGNAPLLLALSGEGIAPFWHPVEARDDLELVAVALHHAKLELADPKRATGFRAVDAAGAAVELFAIGVGGVTRLHSVELVEGRSRTIGVPEGAVELVLERDGLDVGRVPLALEPGRLNVLRP